MPNPIVLAATSNAVAIVILVFIPPTPRRSTAGERTLRDGHARAKYWVVMYSLPLFYRMGFDRRAVKGIPCPQRPLYWPLPPSLAGFLAGVRPNCSSAANGRPK